MMFKRLLSAGLILSLTACATQFGTDFNSKGMMAFTPGVTTRAEALSVVSTVPLRSETVTLKKDQDEKELPQPLVAEQRTYYYRDVRAQGTSIDKEAKRYAWLTIAKDKVISYSVSSTFPDDSTDFNENGAKQLLKGTSTHADVMRIMGSPSGKAVYPAAREPDGDRWYYRVRWWADNKMNSKYLRVDFNKAGVVTDFNLRIGDD